MSAPYTVDDYRPALPPGTDAASTKPVSMPSRLRSLNAELVEALKAILPFIPKTTASDGGAASYSANVRAADLVRAALSKAQEKA